MQSVEAVKQAAAVAEIAVTHIGPKLGKRPNYVSVIANQGRDPSGANLAAMLSVCGYALAAVPVDDLPESAIVIDPADR